MQAAWGETRGRRRENALAHCANDRERLMRTVPRRTTSEKNHMRNRSMLRHSPAGGDAHATSPYKGKPCIQLPVQQQNGSPPRSSDRLMTVAR